MKNFALVIALAASAFSAQAQTYGEIGYTGVTYKEKSDGVELKASPSAIRGILGYELNSNLAIEGLLAVGVGDSKGKVNGQSITGLELGVTNVVGIYLKPKVKLSNDFEIFGRFGYASSKAEISLEGVGSESVSENSFSYGAGFNYAINTNVSLNIDYMQYVNKDGAKGSGYTLGVGYKF